jgi:hypothetical protein
MPAGAATVLVIDDDAAVRASIQGECPGAWLLSPAGCLPPSRCLAIRNQQPT